MTPLRDGMNLVAKEYVAAQRPEDPGALVLSRFAGAAQELNRAILVNPYDPDEIAEGLHMAVTMPLAERQERWRAMKEAVWCNTAVAWSDRFLAKLTKAAVQVDRDGVRRSLSQRQICSALQQRLESVSTGSLSLSRRTAGERDANIPPR